VAVTAVALTAASWSSCSAEDPATPIGESTSSSSRPGEQQFPDVLEVALSPTGDGRYDVAVTLSSPYDTPERYADGWRVMAPDGTVLGEHTLLHDHAAEQPFTRTQPGLAIPDDVDEVTLEGRDRANGFGGARVTVPVPR
jgi:hypothetical protein